MDNLAHTVNDLVQTVSIYALPVLFAITLHEAAHGYVARHFGDMTAHAQGRISLNPIRHIDLIGTIIVPLVILTFSKYLFGWAKPVPVNYSALRKPRQHMAWVAVAGPGANLLMALLWAIVLRAAIAISPNSEAWMELAQSDGAAGLVEAVMNHHVGVSEFLVGVSAAGILVNLVLMLLNLLPILPLDGGRILASLLPRRAAWQFAKLEPWGLPLLLLLFFVPVYGSNVLSIILSPLLFESEALVRAMVLL
ncbi:MAG: site-2 protease family protein [Betaproteobacteria bacterium]|nr:MAG: site-2 protease family protein [Betaproteobacteria bacterium]TMI00722.1 MAG: site-2 protease family protein [Betaproteobacteria bacterium]TMI10940.1 MAG: site-2 protease family protein [Betaproteobacteria bacterium]